MRSSLNSPRALSLNDRQPSQSILQVSSARRNHQSLAESSLESTGDPSRGEDLRVFVPRLRLDELVDVFGVDPNHRLDHFADRRVLEELERDLADLIVPDDDLQIGPLLFDERSDAVDVIEEELVVDFLAASRTLAELINLIATDVDVRELRNRPINVVLPIENHVLLELRERVHLDDLSDELVDERER